MLPAARPGAGLKPGKAALAAAKPSTSPLLFHLKTDPGEATDVAAGNPEIVARLEQRIADMKVDLGTSGPAPGSRALGKVENPQPLIGPDAP